MLLFSLITFITALVLLTALFATKRFGHTLERRFLSVPRAKADRFIIKVASVLEDSLLKHGTQISKDASHKAAYHTSSLLLVGVQLVERRLRALTDMIKGRIVVKKDSRSASFYLKDIAEHKRRNWSTRDL